MGQDGNSVLALQLILVRMHPCAFYYRGFNQSTRGRASIKYTTTRSMSSAVINMSQGKTVTGVTRDIEKGHERKT